MNFKKYIRHIAHVGQKRTFHLAKRIGKKVAGHALIAAGTVAGSKYGGPAGAIGHEVGTSLAGY